MCADKAQIDAITCYLKRMWPSLVDGDHYQIPETWNDLLKHGPFPDFTIGHSLIYASAEVRQTVFECAEEIRKVLGPHLFSISSIASVVSKQIKVHLSSEQTQPLNTHIRAIIDALRNQDQRRMFVQVLHGLKLKDLTEICHGSWRIVKFTDELAEQFANNDSSDSSWKSHISSVLKKGFCGQTCILIESRGDPVQAQRNAVRSADTLSIHCDTTLPSISVARNALIMSDFV